MLPACPVPLYKQLVEQRRASVAIERMGYEIDTIVAGDGKTIPKKGDLVTIHYVGKLVDDTIFDSSVDRGFPFQTEIGVGKVIKGWDQAVLELSVGQKATIRITADFAYGCRGFPPLIAPNSDLIFEVELLKVN